VNAGRKTLLGGNPLEKFGQLILLFGRKRLEQFAFVLSRFSPDDRQLRLAAGRESDPVRSAILFVAHSVDESSAFKFVGHGDQPAGRHADRLGELPLRRPGIAGQEAQDADQCRGEVYGLHSRGEFRGRVGSQLSQ
jgi:hypothetical protein